MSEPTITAGGKTLTVEELVKAAFDNLLGDALARNQTFAEILDKAIVASRHNADLAEALEDGTAFRIAFKKPGESEWTRVHFEEEGLLQKLALEEVTLRQAGLMDNLCDLLGVNELAINLGE